MVLIRVEVAIIIVDVSFFRVESLTEGDEIFGGKLTRILKIYSCGHRRFIGSFFS